jgi:hypothetical protein
MNWNAIQAIGAVLAAVVALIAWRTSVNALRATYRPVIRPVPLWHKHTSLFDPQHLKLKNIGRGPAIGVLIFRDGMFDEPIAEVDVVEPLGPPLSEGEKSRIGNVEVPCAPGEAIGPGERYRVVYQDLDGTWHSTRFDVVEDGFQNIRYLGRATVLDPARGIPDGALRRGHVIPPDQPAQ